MSAKAIEVLNEVARGCDEMAERCIPNTGVVANEYRKEARVLRAAAELVGAAARNPCRHTSEHDGTHCETCKALAALERAAEEQP